MSKPRFIGIVGHKKSGKTTLVELLTKEMTSRGLSVGTIKITTHDLEFDSPGKDTHRHRVAGSCLTLIKSKNHAALFSRSDYLNADMIDTLFGKCDFVFIEGDSTSSSPKIYVSDDRAVRQDISGEIIAVWGAKTDTLVAGYFAKDQTRELSDFLIDSVMKGHDYGSGT
jgi:molybdopterin-guanine dinucleotide biosynthesis protein MobB